MKRYKQSTVQDGASGVVDVSVCPVRLRAGFCCAWPNGRCQEKRYMDMPREWEEKVNRETVNVGGLKTCLECIEVDLPANLDL